MIFNVLGVENLPNANKKDCLNEVKRYILNKQGKLSDALISSTNVLEFIEATRNEDSFGVVSEQELVRKLRKKEFKEIVTKQKSSGFIGKNKCWDYELKKSIEDTKRFLVVYNLDVEHIDIIENVNNITTKKPLKIDLHGNVYIDEGKRKELPKKIMSIHEITKKESCDV